MGGTNLYAYSHIMYGRKGQLQHQARKLHLQLQQLDQLRNRFKEVQAQVISSARVGPSGNRVELDAKDIQVHNLIDMYKEMREALKRTDREIQLTMDKINSLSSEQGTQQPPSKIPHKNPGKNPSKAPEKRKSDDDSDKSKKFKINTDVLSRGRQVAAKTSKRGEMPETWILATVMRYYDEDAIYEVEDAEEADEEDSYANSSQSLPASPPAPRKPTFFLPPQNIIPLPSESHISEFQKNAQVLAVFPRTTSFYPAIFVKKGKNPSEFLLNFADDEDEFGKTPVRAIDARFVVSKDQRLSKKN